MVSLGFSLQPQYTLPISTVIGLLASSGFSAVSPLWSPDLDLAQLAACTDAHNMSIQSLHAPHRGIPLLWKPDAPDAAGVQAATLGCIDACAEFQIPIAVLHCWQGLSYTFPKEPLDFRIFDALVEHAQNKGVSIALENLEGEEYLHALMARYHDASHIGFCWDSGHDHCYPHKQDFLAHFGHRLMMTHINDNLGLRDPAGIPSGDDDLHFLPYDGNIQWESVLRKFKTAPRQAILNFECKARPRSKAPADQLYTRLSPESFIQTAANRARRIAALYEKIMTGNTDT